MNKYKIVIGLEMHCELTSNSKVFSPSSNSFTDKPNSNVYPLDMALPGTLPLVNKECVRKALMMSIILNCKQPEYLYFDRKNYFYPDLPKGYQITQMHSPIGTDGYIDIHVNDSIKKVYIHDIHLEEDTASLDHYQNTSLINYNRAGVPLLELVTEPCLNSKEEAIAFLEYIMRVYRYCGISEADIKKGQVRCDVNISIMDYDAKELGTKVEIKGVNSVSVGDAIDAEVKRQISLKDAGKYDEITQETRRFDEASNTTIRMRSKEEAIDYKYFVEPNIPKYKISSEWIQEIKENIPMLPNERKQLYKEEFGLNDYDISIILKEKDYADYFEKCVELGANPKSVANYLITNIIAYLNKEMITLDEFYLKPTLLLQIIENMDAGKISSKQAKEIFMKSLEEKKEPISYVNPDNLQNSNKDDIITLINEVLDKNKSQIEEYKKGKTNLFGYFVGQVMKESKGKANPSMTSDLLKQELDKR